MLMRWLVIGLAVCWVRSAYADDGKPRVWEANTTPAQREKAHKIFSTGNDHFFKREYAKALELYEQALAVFDHPRIRLAAAEVLVMLGRPADADVQLEAALRFGSEPFDRDEHTRAVELRKTLANQLGSLVVKCTTAGAALTLDGRDPLACPGETRRVVLPGRHQLVGKAKGYVTLTEDVLVEPGKQATATITLKKPEIGDGFTTTKRWPAWKPWAVIGAGAGVALIGAPLQWRASANMQAFRDEVNTCGATGCPAGHAAFELESRAILQNRIAISLWVVGGAAATVGAIGLYMNRERLVPVERRPAVVIVPALDSTSVGLSIAGEL